MPITQEEVERCQELRKRQRQLFKPPLGKKDLAPLDPEPLRVPIGELLNRWNQNNGKGK